MRNKAHCLIVTAGLWLVAPPAYPQQQEMSARDMFHSAAGLVAPAPAKTAPASAPTRKVIHPVRPRPSTDAPAQPATEAAQPAIEAAAQPTTVTAGQPTTVSTGRPSVVTPVSLKTGRPAAPLGLRYSILRRTSSGQTAEVDADTAFRSGDRIRLGIEANDRAYLYIVLRGSSGNWSVLFPSPEISNGNNVIERGKLYEIPSGHWFTFDEQAGTEKLFIVLSRKPEESLEKMFYSLQQAPGGAPVAAPARETPTRPLLAMNLPPVDDALVTRIRSQVVARDLVFEKVSDDAASDKKEKAVYIVNKTGSADSRVVADVTMSHK